MWFLVLNYNIVRSSERLHAEKWNHCEEFNQFYLTHIFAFHFDIMWTIKVNQQKDLNIT